MAHFRGTIEGNRGAVSRLGSRNSGLRVTAHGWGIGATVNISHFEGEDIITIWLNAGSGHGNQRRSLGSFRSEADKS